MSARGVLRAVAARLAPAAAAGSGPRHWEIPAAASARRITFRFGLSGLRWGESGPVVLMMHGRRGRPTQFRYFAEPLLASGRQIVALDVPDERGAGDDAALSEFAAALGEAAVELRELETVLGHGLGAAAAALALSQGLPAERAVLIATPALATLPGGRVDLRQLAPRLRVPALIVHDGDDRAAPFVEAEALARAWPGARLLATGGRGRGDLLTDPVATQGVAEFLAGHDAGFTACELQALAAVH